MISHVEVDPDLCVGSGDCTLMAPGVFAIDDDEGVATVLEGVHAVPSEVLERAAHACPTGAITIAEDKD